MIEPIGFATILVGLLCLRLGDRAVATAMIVASVFGSAAAALIGAANIQPAHMLLGFAALSTFTRREEAVAALRALKPGEPGFWFLCLVVYGCVSAFFLPRIFAGRTYIIPLGTSEYADTGSTVPLGPVSSNFTQSVYMVANLICFAIVSSVAAKPGGFQAATKALIALCAVNVAFAVIDLATYTTGTQGLLDFMRNANYTMHHEEEVIGLKRIVGSFPEASAFARFTLGMLAFSGTLMLRGVRTAWTVPLAAASLLLTVFSTSSSGLAGLAPVCGILYLTALLHCGTGPHSRYSALIVIFVPQIVIAGVLYVLCDPFLSSTILHYVDVVVLSKAGTSSAVERSSWNLLAQQNIIDSYGMGVGLGTIRTSSFVHALVAGVGVVGTGLYALFIGSLFLRRSGLPASDYSDVRMACRNACLGFILGDILTASTIEQGLMFSAFAAVACALPERAAETAATPAPRPIGMREAW